MRSIAAIVVGLLFPFSLHAAYVGVSDQLSSNAYTMNFKLGAGAEDFSQKFDPEKHQDFNLGLSYYMSRTTTEDVTTGQKETSKTTDLYISSTWRFLSGSSFSLGIANHAATADQINGAELNFSYGIQYNPELSMEFGFGRNSISQRFAGKRTTQKLQVVQTWLDFSTEWQAFKWGSPYFSYRRYIYDRNLSGMLLMLDHPSIVEHVGSGLSNTLSTFSDNSMTLGLIIYAAKYEVDISYSSTQLATSSDSYNTLEVEVDYNMDDWVLTGGLGQSKASGSAATGYLSVGAQYNF